MHKVHAPALGRAHRDRSRAAVQRDMLPSSHSHPQLEPIEPIQAANALAIDEPPLTPQQDPNPHVAKPRLRMSQITNAQPKRRLIFRAAASIPRGSTKLCSATGPRTAHLKRPVKPLGPVPGGGRAVDFFSQGLREHVLVEGEVGHQAFQPTILLFHLPQSAEFAHTEVRVLLFPGIKCLLGDAELPAKVADGGTVVSLAEGIDDLLFGEFRPLHRSTPFVEDR